MIMTKMREEMRRISCVVPAEGFEITYLRRCSKMLELYQEALVIMEDETREVGFSMLGEVYQQMCKLTR